MIHLTTKNGAKIQIECIVEENQICKILTHIYKPEFLLELFEKVKEHEEIFLDVGGYSRLNTEEAIHYLIHLDKRDLDGEKLLPPLGTWIMAFYTDMPHREELPKMIKILKSKFKNLNEWDETIEFQKTDEEAINLPKEE